MSSKVKITIIEESIVDLEKVIPIINGIDPTTHVEVEVVVDMYDRCDLNDERQRIKYEGQLLYVLYAIMNKHSYGQPHEDEEMTCGELVESIVGQNGDGCDYIETMELIDKSTGEVVRII